MPDEIPILGPRSLAKVREATRYVQGTPRRGDGLRRGAPSGQSSQELIVKVGQAVGLGVYEGTWYDLIAATITLVQGAPCFVFALNSASLTVGAYYAGLLWGDTGALGKVLPLFSVSCGTQLHDTGGGGGSGGGGGTDCSTGACGSSGVPSTLTATVTAKVGCYTGLPDTLHYTCVNAFGGGHVYVILEDLSICGGSTSGTGIDFLPGGRPTILLPVGPDAGGITNAEDGWSCDPFAAVFHVDDGSGDTCTVTVTSP